MTKKLIARKAKGKGPNQDPEKPYWKDETPGRPGWNIQAKKKGKSKRINPVNT